MFSIALHPLLQYYHHDAIGYPCSHILWDLKDDPATSVRFSKNRKRIPDSHLASYATEPPVSYLVVTCDVFPFPWRIEARDRRGVTVLELLQAIYHVGQSQIKVPEWNGLSPKHRERVAWIFDQRWSTSRDPHGVRARGVIRADCLLQSTGFGGLSMSCEDKYSYVCIMTLSRNSRY
jgi:hypothetical protein